MLRLTLLLCFGVIRCSAHITTSTASPEAGEQQETSPSATETGDPHKIVIHSDSTNVQVFPNGKSNEHEEAEMRTQLTRMDLKLADMELKLDRAALLNTELQTQLTALQKAVDGSAYSGGSVYTRWGSKTCPDSAPLLYSGVMGGSHYTAKGAAANALCLPLNPVYDGHPVPQHGPTQLYGAEYEVYPEAKNNQDPLCAVCLSPRPYTVMVPATNTCHSGWTVEYTGYLMAGYHGHDAATEFICMDAKRDARIGSSADHNGKRFYYTVSKCGSLPCPPYEEGKIVTCVVCSK